MKLSGISLESLEPAIEKIAGLTPVQRSLICVVTVGFLAGVFGYFFYYPQYNRLDKMTGQLKQLEQQLATAKIAAAQIVRFRQEMKDAEEDFRISRNALPDKEEIPLLLTGISQFGHDAGLEFILFEPKPEIVRDFYAEIPVSVTVSGNYHNVGVFFDKVSNLHRIVNIKDIKMVPPVKDLKTASPANDATRLVTSCTAVTYKFVETPAAADNKDAAKGAQKPAGKK
ncbi:MAG: type 4a pilus biogenesis protein PilO [Desulfatirhabdiaceae bacterium]|nr:type 4a pilus biogenesis protein PilO [Desulfatirhabdiaceae bacterium]